MTIRAAALVVALAVPTATSAQDRPPLDALAAQVERSPDDAAARRALAARYTEEGRPEAAVPHLAWLADTQPADPDLLRRLAQHLVWTDQPARAAEVLARLVEVDPADDDARVQLAEIVTWDGGADRAVRALAPSARRRPADARVQRAYAFALLAASDRGARAQLDRALTLAPDDAVLLLESASLERWQGDWSLAERRARRALSLGLDAEAGGRARELLAGVTALYAPVVTTRTTLSDDSNGVERVTSPLRVESAVSSRWSVGVDGVRDLISGQADGRARSLSYVPYLVLTPSRAVRIEIGAGGRARPP